MTPGHFDQVVEEQSGDPPTLVLDEPTAGLDRATARRLVDDVVTASDGSTVLYVTHRDEELGPFDAVAVVDSGKVVDGYRPGGPTSPGGVDGSAGPSATGRDARRARAST